jgi:membrane associated rhomboid family serine protease
VRSPVLIVVATVIVAGVIALIGETLSFSSAAYLAAFVIGLLAISLLDRDRFRGADLRRTRAPR